MSDELDGWSGAEFVLAADRLDTPDVISTADPGDMLRQVASSAAQVRTALRSCQETDLSAFTADSRPRAIVVAGMGSSGLAGEMLQALAGLSSPVQVVMSPADRLPGWVGAADAVIAVSCSGTTGETLAIAAEAARRGCRLACVGAQGSALHRIAEQSRAPFVPVVSLGLPRSMLWGTAIPLLVIAERLGIARVGADVYELAAGRLEEVSHQCRPASESFVNPGKSLALDLVGALPVVWGTSLLSGVGMSELAMDGEHPLVRLAGVIHLADYASVYLAIASGIDPGQAVAVADLQARIE
jgi:glucose/mannose-6-phosphate isomerase